ncbi:MAG: Acylphosphatase [Candidatus Methanolliviera sp. GoM_asphalt]|nr:MAG: Acylphosphatase [Candidatus Methanolliviera sp. GoM_asphalt]
MKLKATIIGEVHDVGYRVFLTNIALEFGIDRFSVFNTFIEGKESVLCLVDAEEEILKRLKERINTQIPDGAIVEDIRYEDHRSTVPPIERCMQAFQMEHWGKAIPIMMNMIGKQDQMLDKQDETLSEIRETRREVVDKQDETLGEIRGMRQDLKSYMNERFNYIEGELTEIKKVLRNAGIMG